MENNEQTKLDNAVNIFMDVIKDAHTSEELKDIYSKLSNLAGRTQTKLLSTETVERHRSDRTQER